VDRLQPFILNYYTEGGSWKVHGVRRQQVEKRMEATCSFSPALKDLVNKIIDEAVGHGWIKA
ncbi:MAG: phosphohydrolase, partial [Bdellovibrionia bacterium]